MGLPRSWSLIFSTSFLLALVAFVNAEPASLPFQDCTSGNALENSLKINITTVYGQVITTDALGKHLNLTVIGNTGQAIIPVSQETGLLSTLFTSSSVLSFSVWENSTFFCSTLVPPSPLPPLADNATNYYCPLAAGPIAFSATIPFNNHSYEIMTLNTRLRIVDTSEPAVELGCIDVSVTPLAEGLNSPGDGRVNTFYGPAVVAFWVSVGLALSYWILVGVARITAAWRRGTSRSQGIWSRVENAGFILASAISGEQLASTPALMRFGTPSMRDVVFHTQWCSALAMVAVQWPTFTYPLFAQTAWSTLAFNITLTQGSSAEHWDPLGVQPYSPPTFFADQLADPQSPIFVDASLPNEIFTFPPNATEGIEMFAAAVGLRPQDLFGVSVGLFLIIIGITIAISLIIWGVDHVVSMSVGQSERDPGCMNTKGTPYSSGTGTSADKNMAEDGTAQSGHFLLRSSSLPLSNPLSPWGGRSWWNRRIRPNSFHGRVLLGNLVRILILFHLPITIFSCYQFTLGHPKASTLSMILAVLSFLVFSVAIPIVLIIRLSRTATNKLYDETRTLLMLGPLYNHYAHGSQLFACLFFATNLAFGITIGCGQKSGTAQAIIILIIEVVSALGTSIWLPWGNGASMGLISFLFCVARIIIAVLLVILTPIVSVGDAASGWVACAILIILAMVYLGFLVILSVKLIEAILRIAGGISFHESKHNVDSGLFGVMGLLGCCGPRRGTGRSPHLYRPTDAAIGRASFSFTPHFTPTRSHTAGPPSVLRPELALRPYREDSDDESGYIMGAWQPFPRPGYTSVGDPLPSPDVDLAITPVTAAKSGFTRVGGGRANFDSPYAISNAPGIQMQEFPSVERITPNAPFAASGMLRNDNDSSANGSVVSVNRTAAGLPAGAHTPTQPPVHIRTKSQTAIIENAPNLSLYSGFQQGGSHGGNNLSDQERRMEPPLAPPQIIIDDDDSSSDNAPRRRHWYNIRRTRRVSEGDDPTEGIATIETPPPLPTAETGDNNSRSFMVLRGKGKRPVSLATPITATTDQGNEGGSTGRSFVVLRSGAGSNASAEPRPRASADAPLSPPAQGSSRKPRRLSHN